VPHYHNHTGITVSKPQSVEIAIHGSNKVLVHCHNTRWPGLFECLSMNPVIEPTRRLFAVPERGAAVASALALEVQW
jgi:hypothetical protein